MLRLSKMRQLLFLTAVVPGARSDLCRGAETSRRTSSLRRSWRSRRRSSSSSRPKNWPKSTARIECGEKASRLPLEMSVPGFSSSPLQTLSANYYYQDYFNLLDAQFVEKMMTVSRLYCVRCSPSSPLTITE
jgi:hypothetical protein